MFGPERKCNSKNVFMNKITKLLSDDNLIETIKNENEWLIEKIQTNSNIIKNDSSQNLRVPSQENFFESKNL